MLTINHQYLTSLTTIFIDICIYNVRERERKERVNLHITQASTAWYENSNCGIKYNFFFLFAFHEIVTFYCVINIHVP